MSDCFPPASCQCCECQGKMCHLWHPGHSHRTDRVRRIQALLDATKKVKDAEIVEPKTKE